MTKSPYAKVLLPIVASSAGAVVVKADHPDVLNITYVAFKHNKKGGF
jgi:hypothetical protein